jgi:hypothetical protein
VPIFRNNVAMATNSIVAEAGNILKHVTRVGSNNLLS